MSLPVGRKLNFEPSYEVQMFELRPGINKSDAELIEAAKAAVKAGRCGEAGTLVKNVKDEDLRMTTIGEISNLITDTFGASSEKAYDGTNQFLDNVL